MKQTEIQESIAFSQWLSVNGYLYTHIANESGLPPKIAMLVAIKKKKMGVKPGVPDYMIILKRGSILFIEMKRTLVPTDYRKDGKLLAGAPQASPEQVVWIEALDAIDNISACVAWGLKEAIAKVQYYENL